MNRFISVVSCVVIIGLVFTSCVSHSAFMMPPAERSSVYTLGTVSVRFGSFQPLHVPNKQKLERKAQALLFEEARKRYGADAEVINITMRGQYGFSNYLLMLAFYSALLVNHQTITATGDVISRHGGIIPPTNQPPRPPAVARMTGLDNAVAVVSSTLISKLPQGATIAVLNISSNSTENSQQAIDELEYLFVNSGKFVTVDRKRLDDIRSEQIFQMSGEVNDETAVRIGNLIGASIVILGQITTRENSSQRLSVKALDVKTATILSMERADF